jgi:hypothetical protein
VLVWLGERRSVDTQDAGFSLAMRRSCVAMGVCFCLDSGSALDSDSWNEGRGAGVEEMGTSKS